MPTYDKENKLIEKPTIKERKNVTAKFIFTLLVLVLCFGGVLYTAEQLGNYIVGQFIPAPVVVTVQHKTLEVKK